MEKKKEHLPIPRHVREICEALENAGFAAFVVGGCVRDLLLSKTPHDYDVTTAARPEVVKALFSRTHDTGILHGTVTVVTDAGCVEVTTFRKDGTYSDNRRPDSVTFLSEIEGDLARRDFTVNAMAYSEKRGLCDPFGGQEDLKQKRLRTVGIPEKRFSEDALRILRLFRFAAQLSFSIEDETLFAAEKMAATLSNVSRERIFAELQKLLSYADFDALLKSRAVFRAVLPEIEFCKETLVRVAACPSLPGKWAHLGGIRAGEILEGLHAPRALILSARELAVYQKTGNIVWDVAKLSHTTRDDFFAFLQDETLEKAWEDAKKAGVPTAFCELAISGHEIEAVGFSGRDIGMVLDRLFMYAIENPANNRKEKLWEETLWIYKQGNFGKA